MQAYNFYYEEDSCKSTHRKPIAVQKPLAFGYSRAGISKKHDSEPMDISSDWARDIIPARGNQLVKKGPLLLSSFRISSDLNELAKIYLKDDYKISPRTARRIIFYALERLVDKNELMGIDPDPVSQKSDKGRILS